MMIIQFVCPAGHALSVSASEIGETANCPICGVEVIVPKRSSRSVVAASAARNFPTPLPPPRQSRRGYQPDPDKVATVRWLGAALALLALIGFAPAYDRLGLVGAPTWAQIVVLLSLLQLVYVLWMVTLPDWSTVWVLMLVFTAVSALYGFTLAVSIVTPFDRPLLLEMTGVRRAAPVWCGAMMVLNFLGAFLSGRCSSRWHRTYVRI